MCRSLKCLDLYPSPHSRRFYTNTSLRKSLFEAFSILFSALRALHSWALRASPLRGSTTVEQMVSGVSVSFKTHTIHGSPSRVHEGRKANKSVAKVFIVLFCSLVPKMKGPCSDSIKCPFDTPNWIHPSNISAILA